MPEEKVIWLPSIPKRNKALSVEKKLNGEGLLVITKTHVKGNFKQIYSFQRHILPPTLENITHIFPKFGK